MNTSELIKAAQFLSKRTAEELAFIYKEWSDLSFNDRVGPLIRDFKALDLDAEQSATLIARLESITWKKTQKQLNRENSHDSDK